MNEGMINNLETLADLFNNKFKCGLQGTFRASKPYYELQQSGTTWSTIEIPKGSYEFDSLRDELFRLVNNKNYFEIDVNPSTFKTIIEIKNPSFKIDFTKSGTIRDLLGYSSIILEKGKNESDKTIQITNTRAINVHCDLITGSYDSEGKLSDIIYSFPAYKVGPGFKIVEDGFKPRYYPVIRQVIDKISFRVTDNNNMTLDFNDEPIAWCIYIRQV
jgi:hypothetical protein